MNLTEDQIIEFESLYNNQPDEIKPILLKALRIIDVPYKAFKDEEKKKISIKQVHDQKQVFIGQMVHYQSYGTPNGEYKSETRAAIITHVYTIEKGESFLGQRVDLCIINPSGLFFGIAVEQGDDPGQWNWITKEL